MVESFGRADFQEGVQSYLAAPPSDTSPASAPSD